MCRMEGGREWAEQKGKVGSMMQSALRLGRGDHRFTGSEAR